LNFSFEASKVEISLTMRARLMMEPSVEKYGSAR
jgi:hypothetical protein